MPFSSPTERNGQRFLRAHLQMFARVFLPLASLLASPTSRRRTWHEALRSPHPSHQARRHRLHQHHYSALGIPPFFRCRCPCLSLTAAECDDALPSWGLRANSSTSSLHPLHIDSGSLTGPPDSSGPAYRSPRPRPRPQLLRGSP